MMMIFMKRLPWWCVWRWTPLCLLRSWSQETSDWGIKTCSLSMKIIVRWQGAMMSTWLSWNIWRIWGQLREKKVKFYFYCMGERLGVATLLTDFLLAMQKNYIWTKHHQMQPLPLTGKIFSTFSSFSNLNGSSNPALLVFVTIQKRLVHINPI